MTLTGSLGLQHRPDQLRGIGPAQQQRHRQQHMRHRAPRQRDRRGRTGSANPITRRDRAKPHPASTPSGHDGHRNSPAANRDSTRTGSTSTVTISASEHYSAAPRQAGQDFSGVPKPSVPRHTDGADHQHQTPVTPPTPSAPSTTPTHPVVVVPSDGQQPASGRAPDRYVHREVAETRLAERRGIGLDRQIVVPDLQGGIGEIQRDVDRSCFSRSSR